MQGNIVVRDPQNMDEDQVKIDLDRMGPSEEVVNQVTVNRTIVDVGYGKVFVLQVVSTRFDNRTTSIGRVCLLENQSS